MLKHYRQDLGQLIKTCKQKQLKIVFMTQPTMYRPDLPEDLEQLLWFPPAGPMYKTAVLGQMMDAYNQVLLDVCKQEQVDCIDLASMLPKDTNSFYDDCHLNTAGCQKVADILADYFDRKLSVPE